MLVANAVLTFTEYEALDSGILLKFVCTAPGAGEPTDYHVLATNAEIAAVTSLASFRTLVDTLLQRKFRAANIASKLDAMIGQSRTI